MSGQPLYLAIDDGDAFRLRTLWQSRHTEHIAGDGYYHLTAAVQDDVADADGEALGRAVARGVGRE